MKRERIVEFVGGSEEEIAFLRLLLRKAAGLLADRWRLRREDDGHVDVLVIPDLSDPGLTLPGSSDDTQRRVRLVDSVFGAAGMETLPWPPPLEQIARMLNLTSAASEPSPAFPEPGIEQNVYDDLFEPAADSRWTRFHDLEGHAGILEVGTDWVPPPREPESALTLEAELLFRRDPTPEHREALASIRLDDAVGIESTGARTARGGTRKDQRVPNSILSSDLYTLSIEEARQQHPLASYLTGRMLPGPMRIEVCHLELTLDPRSRQFYTRGSLGTLEACCRQTLRRGDWQGLTASEFDGVRETIPARPYAALLWLCHYLDDHHPAAAELAPERRYRLIQSVDLSDDYAGAARVARELERGATLAAAASLAGVPTALAQRIAAAFDAVGILIPD